MTKVTNIAGGDRGIWTTKGLVMLTAGETRDLELAKGASEGEWFTFGDAAAKALHDHTVAELKQIAEDENIDLGDATKKDDIISAIELGREG